MEDPRGDGIRACASRARVDCVCRLDRADAQRSNSRRSTDGLPAVCCVPSVLTPWCVRTPLLLLSNASLSFFFLGRYKYIIKFRLHCIVAVQGLSPSLFQIRAEPIRQLIGLAHPKSFQVILWLSQTWNVTNFKMQGIRWHFFWHFRNSLNQSLGFERRVGQKERFHEAELSPGKNCDECLSWILCKDDETKMSRFQSSAENKGQEYLTLNIFCMLFSQFQFSFQFKFKGNKR